MIITMKECDIMKRFLILFIALVLCVTSLAACAGNTSDTSTTSTTIEETVLLDDQGIKAVAKSFGKYEGEFLTVDNALLIDVSNQSDKAIAVSVKNSSVNGYMINSGFSLEIKAGETAVYPVVFEDSALERYDITTYADIGFSFVVSDAKTYEIMIETDPVTIKTSAAETYSYEYDESGEVLYDTDGIKIVAKGTCEDEYVGQCVTMYVSNQTDKQIGLYVSEGSVNGKTADIYYGAEVLPGKHSVDLLSFGENNRVDTIESVTLTFDIFDMVSGEPIVEKIDPVTVTF